MRFRLLCTVLMLVAGGCAGRNGAGLVQPAPDPLRPVSTYSIVARDPQTGALGVAVQSHWFGVGSVVPWARATVGAVATQALADPAYGPKGLQLMGGGIPADAALQALIKADEGRAVRQVAMIDARGRVAAHTGEQCIDFAGQVVDAERQFSVQANLMARPGVPEAMAAAYTSHKGDLAERLMAALEAAERAGGDLRGRQSAALLVVTGEPTGRFWEDRLFDLSVEDHPQPLQELRRLLRLQRAYNHMNAGDQAIEKQDFEAARRAYAAAEELAPDIIEIPFWQAVSMVNAGSVEPALPVFRRVFQQDVRYAELVPRLARAGLLPDDSDLLERILQMKAPGGSP